MYSIGTDRKLYVTCMTGDNKDQVHIKCSNMSPKTMVLHEEYDRLFVSMKQGMLFVFDVSEMYPIVLQSI